MLYICGMALLQKITVKEDVTELRKLIANSTPAVKPRIKMLLSIVQGVLSTSELVQKTKANRDSIRNWKNVYREQGIEGLLKEDRGGKRFGTLNEEQKAILHKKLSEVKGGFTSYIEAKEWINTTFGVKMNYPAVVMYLKRNFGTKLKVARKTHVNKDENASALFKKPVGKVQTY